MKNSNGTNWLHELLGSLPELSSEKQRSELLEKYRQDHKSDDDSLVLKDIEMIADLIVKLKSMSNSKDHKVEALSELEREQLAETERIIDENLFDYYFQPIVNTIDGEIYSYEALMRPKSTMKLTPLHILKYAGLVNRLSDIERGTFLNVLQIVDLRKHEFSGKLVFINSIPEARVAADDYRKISQLLLKHADTAVVEMTEQSQIDDENLDRINERYRNMGVKMAIDDYGTGYSNIGNLLRYTPDFVKIDRSLLSEIQSSPKKRHFVREIIQFCHDNNILALAEGIETTEEIETVINLGVDLIQGYYTARPSEYIIKEIAPEVKEEIVKYSSGKVKNRTKKDYIAGREARISLPIVIKDGYNTIRVTSGQVTHRDLHIQGVPGDDAVIHLEIENGYKGRIALENCCFTGRMHDAAITIGDDCDVIIALNGDNVLSAGGIKVAPSSTLTFEGAGNLSMSCTGTETFGIGNDMDSYHGDLIFDQDGRIEISVNANKSVALGSGLGGHITIRRGMYKLNLMGQTAVGIGSISGDIDPIISNCYLEITSVALTAVGVGSITGRCDMMIEHISMKADFNGSKVAIVGSIDSGKLKISVYSATISMKSGCDNITCFGSLNGRPSNINIDYISLKVDLSGKLPGLYRGNDKSVKIRVANSKIEGSIFANAGVPDYSKLLDYKVAGSLSKLDINGEMVVENTMSIPTEES